MSDCTWWKRCAKHVFFSASRLSAGIHPFDKIPARFLSAVSSMSNRASLLIQIHTHTHAPCICTRSDKSPNRHVLMCEHDLLVSRYTYAASACIFTRTQTLTQTDTLTVTWISMWVRRRRGREMQMLLFSSQWHGIHGEMNMCSWEKEGDSERERFRERDGADSLCILCVSPALTHIAVKEHACQAAKIDDWMSQEDVASPTSPSLFTYVSHFSFPLSLFRSVMCLLRGRPRRRASYAAYFFPFFSIPILASSSLRVPCCFSCIVRLQVVWVQDLWEHMRAGETPWLTWLLRGRDGQKEKEMEIKADMMREYIFRHFRVGFGFLVLLCSR